MRYTDEELRMELEKFPMLPLHPESDPYRAAMLHRLASVDETLMLILLELRRARTPWVGGAR